MEEEASIIVKNIEMVSSRDASAIQTDCTNDFMSDITSRTLCG
jgi:hypothetical protein